MTIGNFVDYLWTKTPIPVNPNTYQTWWGLIAMLHNDLSLVGRSFVQESTNEHHRELEYHRIDPLSVAVTEKDGKKVVVHQWQGAVENVFQIDPFIKENERV